MNDMNFNQKYVELEAKKPSARISVALRRLSRDSRRELLASSAYRFLQLGALNREEYAELLCNHFAMRTTLERHLTSLGGQAEVSNCLTGETKIFNIERYLSPSRLKTKLLLSDITELIGSVPEPLTVSAKGRELIEYVDRVKKICAIALLGVLYMFEETVTYAGPRIARPLDVNLELSGRATHYLRGGIGEKANLLAFRSSLDLIGDLQTQVNIVTASTITYRMYKDLLNPPLTRRALASTQLH